MINSDIYNYINVLDKAADAANTRNELLTNNIANVDTPGYKRKDLQFESILQLELNSSEPLSKRVKEVNTHLGDFEGVVYTDNSNLSYRLDRNNVDIHTEEANLAENQIRYQALIDQMTQEFGRYKTVLQ